MKLEKAAKLQKATDIALWLVMLPFGICGFVIEQLSKPFMWIVDWLDAARFRIGNKLLRISDEANDGTIKNEDALRNYTALNAYNKLKEERI